MLGKFPGIEIWKIGSPSLYKGRWKIETYLLQLFLPFKWNNQLKIVLCRPFRNFVRVRCLICMQLHTLQERLLYFQMNRTSCFLSPNSTAISDAALLKCLARNQFSSIRNLNFYIRRPCLKKLLPHALKLYVSYVFCHWVKYKN